MVQNRRSTYNIREKGLNVLSFFSGAMGLDIGLHEVGFKTLLTCEIDNSARQTIVSNCPNVGLIGDIRDYSIADMLDYSGLSQTENVDLIVGGPPCQAFSSAGKRLGLADQRGNVFLKFIEVIEKINPRFAVIENVRGLLSVKFDIDLHLEDMEFLQPDIKDLNGATMFYLYNRLRAAGYNISFNLYNSANFGTPQVRERVIIICSKVNAEVPYLIPTHAKNGEFGLPKWNTLEGAIKDVDNNNSEFIKFPEERLKYYRLLKAGQNWKNLSVEMQKKALGKSYLSKGGKTGFLRRLAWDKPAPTLVTHPAMPATDLAHPDEDRPLSILEYKRIQEFPDEWIIKGSLISKYRQLGNAVPISLGRAIGKLVFSLHKGEEIQQLPNFKYSRYRNTADSDFIQTFILKSKKYLDKRKSNQLSIFT